ncbi:MAG: feruloyl-CoA synthase [Xanthobacteraceae bacterium]
MPSRMDAQSDSASPTPSSLRAQSDVPVRPVRLGARDLEVEHRSDGHIYLRSRQALGPYPSKLTERLEHWAAVAPDRTFVAQRTAAGPWREVSYAQTLDQVRRIGAALLRRDLSADRPILILSGNDVEHALLGLAANYVGIPYAPVSPAYSLISTDFGKLRHIVDLLTPGLVFAADGAAYAAAIEAAVAPQVELVTVRHSPPGRRRRRLPICLPRRRAPPSPRPMPRSGRKASPNSCSLGSTGQPKAVINTQRMWCSNQEMTRAALAYFIDEPPIVVDWAPWHHTAGGNHDVGLVLYNGGTLYIDEGKPLPGAIETTVRNLREIAPTWYFTVPRGFEALLPYFRADAALRANFFSRVKVLWFAGAGIAQHVFDEIQDLAIKTCGERILFLTGFGATETAPEVLVRTWASGSAANVGLPVAGLEFKLAPAEGKLEGRVRGPNITPGYWRQPDLSAAACDEEGFYKLGDAFKFADPDDPAEGLLFDGRTAEDFKLATGTWVNVGPLRAHIINSLAPFVRDVVLSGPDRDDLGVLVFPDVEACRRLAPHLPANAPPDQLLSDAQVRAEFAFLLDTLAKQSTGSSNRVCRAILMHEQPSLDIGEITDKGSINQRMVLRHRAALVDDLHAAQPSSRVIAVAG